MSEPTRTPARPAPSPFPVQHAEPTVFGPTLLPQTPVLQKQTYSSALSFVGITRRTTSWVRQCSGNPVLLAAAIVTATFFLAIMYAFIAFWYLIIFGLFGVFMFPFRLMRRGQRKQEHLQRTQLATMQALLVQQQAAAPRDRY